MIDQVPIVREFADVFSEELPGLLSERELDFVLDVVPRSVSKSMVPYRMAPSELKN